MRSPVGPPTDPRGVSTRAPRTPPSSNPPSAHPDARDASASPSIAPRASSTTERTSWLFASPPTPWRSVLVSTTSRATRLRRRTRMTTRAARLRRSRPRRSRGGNLTTRDRALRVPYPSRLLLACARGDATQRLAAPGGSRWTRRERLDVPSSARSGCFGSRSLGSRLCDARAGFLPHTPPTLTQPRVAHPDGSVPFPVYRLES